MKKNLSIKTAIIGMALLASVNTFVYADPIEEIELPEIPLIRKDLTNPGDNSMPSKKPPMYTCPVHVYYDETGESLYFAGTDGTVVSYAIYDEDDSLLQSGSVALSNGASVGLQCSYADMYTIEITVNGITYSGML